MTELIQTLNNLHKKYVEKDFVTAEIGVRDALQKWPNQPDVLRLGALTALALNQFVTADQRLGRASELVPMTAEMANTNGNIRTAVADWVQAEAAYKEAIILDSSYKLPRVNLINLYIKSGQPYKALECLDDGEDYTELGELARIQVYAMLGRYEDALLLLDGVLDQKKSEALLLQQLKCLAVLGRLDEMEEAFEVFDENSPFITDAMAICVNSYIMRGHREQALDVIAKVTASDDVASSALINAAQILNRENENTLSKAILQTAAERFSNDPDVLCQLGQEALKDGNVTRSFETFTECLQLKPGHFPALLGRAQAAIVDGNYSDAEGAIQAALSQAPNNQYIMALGATLQRARGQNHKALYNYEKYVRVYDLKPPNGYSDIAEFNAEMKRELEALHVYSGAPVNQSVRGGTQTETDLAHTRNPILQMFFQSVDAPIHDYMHAIGNHPHHPLLKRNTGGYRISGAWSIRLSQDGHHVNHVHPMGWLSSAYYVDVPSTIGDKNHEGWIKFGEPALNVDQDAEFFVQPKAGRLVLFPSYMWHGTVPFSGDESRLTLPFDVVPA
ncbi:MAG: putative 2OG-Fe(II) oxygenase [Litorimonas sp.]